MARFSERAGITQPAAPLKPEEMPESFRVDLWNLLSDNLIPREPRDGRIRKALFFLTEVVFQYHWKRSVDTIPIDYWDIYKLHRSYVFEQKWHEVLDFLEYLVRFNRMILDQRRYDEPIATFDESLEERINDLFAHNLSAWRLVDAKIVPIIDPVEIESLQESLAHSHEVVSKHIKEATTILSEKNRSDFRNAVKEAISAVEAQCKLITGDDNATLSSALAVLAKKHALPDKLKESFLTLYKWANESGVRHSAKPGDKPVDRDTAKITVIVCSAFVNYLRSSMAP